MVRPEDHLRRTPLLARIDAHDVDHDVAWHALADTAVAWDLGTAADPRRLAIADLSPLPRIGFKGRALAAVEIADSFGQRSLIEFRDLRLNVPVPAERFRFTPPPGADVIWQ